MFPPRSLPIGVPISCSSQRWPAAEATSGSITPSTAEAGSPITDARKASTETAGTPPLGASMRTDTSATRWVVGAEASGPPVDPQLSDNTAPTTSSDLWRWGDMSCEIYIGRWTKGDHYSGGRCSPPGKGTQPSKPIADDGKTSRADMPRIQPEEVREIATLARLRLDPAEVERMTHELDAILGYIDTVMNLDTGDAEPMTHAVPFDCPLRDDLPGEPLPVDEALANAPRREGGFFQVPRIIGGGPAEGM